MDELKEFITPVKDFPKEGILFYDISPLLAHRFPQTIEQMAALYDSEFWRTVDVIAGIDARGFLFASALAMHMKKQLVLVRKPGKLPPPVSRYEYDLEYGSDALEMKAGIGKVLIVDDVLATGGTLCAAANLCAHSGYEVSGFATVIDLAHLHNFSWQGITPKSLVRYDG